LPTLPYAWYSWGRYGSLPNSAGFYALCLTWALALFVVIEFLDALPGWDPDATPRGWCCLLNRRPTPASLLVLLATFSIFVHLIVWGAYCPIPDDSGDGDGNGFDDDNSSNMCSNSDNPEKNYSW